MAQVQDWEMAKKHGRIVAKAWADPAFKERLQADPAAVLKEHGFDDDEAIGFVMPPPPTGEFGDEALSGDVLQAGGCGCDCGGCARSNCFCTPSSPPCGGCVSAPPVDIVERGMKRA
jgi:hypothetical protein